MTTGLEQFVAAALDCSKCKLRSFPSAVANLSLFYISKWRITT